MNLREEMPETYAFIEACREAFGKESVNPMIRISMDGARTFHASENGIEVGTMMPRFDDLPGLKLDKMEIHGKALPAIPSRR